MRLYSSLPDSSLESLEATGRLEIEQALREWKLFLEARGGKLERFPGAIWRGSDSSGEEVVVLTVY